MDLPGAARLTFTQFWLFSPNRASNRCVRQTGVLHRSSGLVAASGGHWDEPPAVHRRVPGTAFRTILTTSSCLYLRDLTSWVPQVKYWRKYDDPEPGANRIFVPATVNQTRLENMLPDAHYLIEVRAFNGAGLGPPGEHCEMFTKRPRKGNLKAADASIIVL